MGDEIRNKRMAYFVCCISSFAERYKLTDRQAFNYLQRFRGMNFKSSSVLVKSFVISVAIKPGATALTLMFLAPNSFAKDLVKPIKPALAAE